MKNGKHTEAIKKVITQIGSSVAPFTLKQLGYSQREIERAVRDGAIRWTSQGRLVTV